MASLLLVCDEPEVAELAVRALAARGHTIERATTVQEAEALVAMQQPPFDAVLIDLVAGTTEALKVLDKIRGQTDEQLARTPAIISAWKEENRLFSWQSGVDGFVVRPYHVDELLDLVEGAIARSEDERQRFRSEQMKLAAGA